MALIKGVTESPGKMPIDRYRVRLQMSQVFSGQSVGGPVRVGGVWRLVRIGKVPGLDLLDDPVEVRDRLLDELDSEVPQFGS